MPQVNSIISMVLIPNNITDGFDNKRYESWENQILKTSYYIFQYKTPIIFIKGFDSDRFHAIIHDNGFSEIPG